MAQPSQPPRTATTVRTTPARGLRPWTRERKIYLAVGILACLAGVLIIAFSR
jgi:hypothetical protein